MNPYVPVYQAPMTGFFRCYLGPPRALPFFLNYVPASFPSPADDYEDGPLDLNELVIRHPAATFYVRVQGNSMTGTGIQDGDLLVVDRAVEPLNGHAVVAALDGELTVKCIHRAGGRLWLMASNDQYPPIEVTGEMELVIWGVVTYVIHAV